MTWVPLLEGRAAARARETIETIAQSLGGPPRSDDVSLAGGLPGLAVFHAYRGERDAGAALLERSIDALATTPMTPSLFDGVAGIAWASAHLDADATGDDDPAAAFDDDLEALLAEPWQGHFDLVGGLAGLGVYALERLPRPAARACLEHVVAHLARMSEATPDGTTWFTPAALLPPEDRPSYPGGYFNLGVAHGVPGVVGLLAAIHDAGVARATVRPLLDGAVRWLRAHATRSMFPAVLARGTRSGDAARSTWCYGDAGVAVVLVRAARSLGDAELADAACELASAAAHRDEPVRSACLCHGSAGLAHLYNRLYQATRRDDFAATARRWFARTLDGRPPREPGLLTGSAGVALALMAATTDVAPAWDRWMLVSSEAA